jgi:predicted Zn-ribbon and HTH transcriptional regulator
MRKDWYAYKNKYLAPASNGSTHIVSERRNGDWECDCLGWTRHMPRITCKHISWVHANNPEPLNLENWEALNGKKKKARQAIQKILENAISCADCGGFTDSPIYFMGTSARCPVCHDKRMKGK